MPSVSLFMEGCRVTMAAMSRQTNSALSLDDLRPLRTVAGIARLYHLLGYQIEAEIEGFSATEAHFEGVTAGDIGQIYLLVNREGSPSLQHWHVELNPTADSSVNLPSNVVRRVSEQVLKRPGDYLLSFSYPGRGIGAGGGYERVVFVKPSRAQGQVNLSKLTLDPGKPSPHEHSVLNDLLSKANDSNDSLHQRQVQAFNVERVTKEFFETYKALFGRVRERIGSENPNAQIGMLARNTTSDRDSLHAFSQRLLSRLLFLYFIQKKGWLDGNQSFLVQLYKNRMATSPTPEAMNFYRDCLEPLFFETLNRIRIDNGSIFGNIPYLNGSLFEREYPESTVLNLPNVLFDPSNAESILGVLERYNFTVSESSSLEQEVSLDPEMLGKVFENLMESEDAAKSGTFYTPRSIVQFLAEESMSRYLSDTTGITLARLRLLMAEDEAFGDLSLVEARAIIKALAQVRVLDPAVGTASMLVGTLGVMIAVRRSCEARLGNHVALGTPVIADWKKHYINHCLYGVDIKQEAIEIGRLRLWLSLVVDADEPEPLPNLDYKLMAGDGVLESIDGTPFISTSDQSELISITPEAAQALVLTAEIEKVRSTFFLEENPDRRRAQRQQIHGMEHQLFDLDIVDRIKTTDYRIVDLSKKGQNRKPADVKREQVLREHIGKLMDLKKKVLEENEPLPFFLHGVHFTEVMHRENPGFDIVIGNPPYVRMERLGKDYKDALHKAFPLVKAGSADLYVYFYNKAYNLLRQGGRLAFITPNKFLRAGYGEALRGFLSSKTKLEVLVDFGDLPVFDATTYPFITIAAKKLPQSGYNLEMLPERTLKGYTGDARAQSVASVREQLTSFHRYAHSLMRPMEQVALREEGWVLDDPKVLGLLDKLRGTGVTLGEFVGGKFYYGIKTGLNKAFVIDKDKRDELIAADPKSAELIKPFLRGRDIKRWQVEFAEKYLIAVQNSGDAGCEHPWRKESDEVKARRVFETAYPAIHAHLSEFEDKLRPRSDQGKFWWELRACAYYQDFEIPKIVYNRFQVKPAFARDSTGSLHNDAAYFIPEVHKWLLPVLNSRLGWFQILQNCTQIQGGCQILADYFKNVIIFHPNPTQQAILESIHDDSRLEELNRVVYEMYNLTTEEIALVESHVGRAGATAGAVLEEDEG
jgi:adenine-specific DNA-methyltransferase